MLQKMRDRSQGLMARIVVGIIIVVLTMFGFGAFTAFVSNDPAVASVNGEDISRGELDVETERQRQRILNQMGEGADPDLIDTASLQGSVLESLINRTLLRQAADDMDLAIADSEIDRFIRENPQFQVAGIYDPGLFERVLRGVGHTPLSFRADFKNSLRMAQLNGAVADTGLVIDWELRLMAQLLAQTRDIAFLSFDPQEYTVEVTLDDHAVEEFYESNRADFMTTEAADFQYVSLSLAELMADASVEVEPELIQARYQQDLEAFELVDERQAAHILLEVNAERDEAATMALARSIRSRLDDGEAFADLAVELSDDPGSAAAGGDLGFTSRGAFVPEFEEAMWALDVGSVSDPVRSEFGVHVILVSDARTPDYPEFDAVRDSIEATVRAEQAATLYAEKVREMDQLAFETEDLTALALELSLDVETANGITRAHAEGPFGQPRVRSAAFAEEVLDQGFNSAVVDEGDRAFVVRLVELHPSQQRPLAEVQDQIAEQLTAAAAQDLAAADAALAFADLGDGKASSQVADASGRDWVVLSNSRRQSPGVDNAITAEAFRLPRPVGTERSVGSVRTAGGVDVVVTVTAVREGDYGALTEAERSGLRGQLTRGIGERDFGSLFQDLQDAASIDRS